MQEMSLLTESNNELKNKKMYRKLSEDLLQIQKRKNK